jgi:hypothetical protein
VPGQHGLDDLELAGSKLVVTEDVTEDDVRVLWTLFRTESFRTHYNRNYGVHPSGREFAMVRRKFTQVVVRLNALAEEQ